MNREQKTAVVEEVAAQIQEAEAVFAVDYRGISVPQAAALRERLTEAGARFRVVKNTLTLLAADKAGAESLKGVLEGPTAFTFVTPEDGDVALAANALAQFKREHDLLDFKGGLMNGEPLTAEQIAELARLPARDVLHGQVVAMIAAPITGLVRTLNALITGLAIQLKQIADEGMVPVGGEAEAAPADEATAPDAAAEEEPATPGEASAEEAPSEDPAAAEEEPATEEAAAPAEPAQEEAASQPSPADDSAGTEEGDPAEAEQAAQAEQAEEEAARSAEDQETESSSEESAPAGAEAAGEETEESETPSEGDEKE
ncbi:MAG TPA: 50S ribosomal protein L10 [Thermoleophilaceae bacterium]